MAIFLVCYERS